MTNLKQTTEQILTSLPVSYYLKRKVEVKLNETERCSSYDILNDRISISFNEIQQGLSKSKLDFDKLSNEDIEKFLRTSTYHEVSHAYITPTKLSIKSWTNIFEDERIETIFKDYYLNTNFKLTNVYMLNFGTTDISKIPAPTSGEQYFWYIVRLRLGPKEFTDEVQRLIEKYKELNKFSDYEICNNYADEIYKLYEKVVNDFEKNKDKIKEETERRFSGKDDEQNEADTKTQQISTKDITNEITPTEFPDTTIKDAKEIIESVINDMNTKSNNLVDNNFQKELEQILFNKTSVSKYNGSAINAYSGIFDTRSVIRDDYKYFVKQNRAGHIKRFSKVKLNLFIDVSGSFYSSENVVNKMLYNLKLLERKCSDFEYDVIAMQMSEYLLKKNNRFIKTGGGNHLDGKIKELYKQVQSTTSKNINIVLFDGDAYSDGKDNGEFNTFNHSNDIIITDDDNYCYIGRKGRCKGATVKYIKEHYADILINEVIKQLKTNLK